MTISGTFKDTCPTQHTYSLTISRAGDPGINYEIVDYEDIDETDPDGQVCWANDPISLSCDYSDTFNHVIVKSASIRLITNTNLAKEVLAYNERDVSVTISRDNSVIFKGYVEPLCFNEPYAYQWESIEITATDELATAQYIKYPELISEHLNENATSVDILGNIANALSLNLVTSALDSDVLSAMTNTNISNSIWLGGGSPDEFMTCEEVLQQLGKYWSLWYITDGTNLIVFDWHNQTRTSTVLSKADYTDDSTNISNADAYNKINITCNVEDSSELISFDNTLENAYDHWCKYMTEYVSEGGGTHACNGFAQLLARGFEEQEGGGTGKTNSYTYDNFCLIKKSKMWKFPSGGYTSMLPGPQGGGSSQQSILAYLRNNRFSGAFVSFGKSDKRTNKSDAVQNSLAMKDYLIISVMGHDGYDSTLQSAIEAESDDNPICSVELPSIGLTPSESNATNYIIISGNMMLNKIYAQTGKPMHWKYSKGGNYGLEMNGGIYLDSLYDINGLDYLNPDSSDYNKKFVDKYLNCTVPKISDNDYGSFYIHKFWDGAFPNEQESSAACLYGDLKHDKYNKTYEYTQSYINGLGKEIDNVSYVPILKCQMKVGDKYCIEKLYEGTSGWGKYVWETEEEAKVTQHTNKPSLYMTIGINPSLNDFIIGGDYSIFNNISFYTDVDGKGTAIPVHDTDKLNGKFEFKIIGPLDVKWNEMDQMYNSGILKTWFYWQTGSAANLHVLERVSSILISDFKIDLKSDNAHILATGENNDIVYTSMENELLTEPHDDDIDICTMITSKEAQQFGTTMTISRSHVMNDDGSPYLGFAYQDTDPNTGDPLVDDNGDPVYAYIKPEQIYVDGFYKEYGKPRTCVNTSVKISDTTYITNPTQHQFTLGFIDGEYVPVGYEAGLKNNYITFNLKDMTVFEIEDEENV